MASAREAGVPACEVGTTGGTRLRIGSLVDVGVEEATEAWYGRLRQAWS